ncbi:MAG TPA: DUF3822 family protein [Candidatus Egerieousia sp.]|nr:DUF3822 family protein [Candidatus Egerieousia sp.]
MVNYYFRSTKFTIVPEEINSPEQQKKIMQEQFAMAPDEIIRCAELPEHHALLLFSLNYTDETGKTAIAGEDTRPIIYKHIKELEGRSEYNKAILDFDRTNKTSYIVINQGDMLMMANSFHTSDSASALYFLLEALRQKQINPRQTALEIYGILSESELALFKSYLKKADAGLQLCV